MPTIFPVIQNQSHRGARVLEVLVYFNEHESIIVSLMKTDLVLKVLRESGALPNHEAAE
jgi:hypothetical protein